MFEAVLAGHPVPRRSALAGPLSATLHVAALAAILAASAWRIADPGEPNVPVVFVAPGSPPPLAGAASSTAAGPGRPSVPRSTSTPATTLPFSAPATLPLRIDPLPDVLPLDSRSAGSGAGPGSPGGAEGGTGDSETPESGTGRAPISATAPNVVPPRLLSQARPEYPEAARRTRQQGVVLLQAVIGTAGDIEDVHVLSSPSPLFAEAAVRAVRQWRYSPATLDRRAVRVYITVTMSFTLH